MNLENSGWKSSGAVRRRVSMHGVVVAVLFAWQAGVIDAAAQAPAATLSKTVVAPGTASAVTVAGVPGHYFAIVGSTTGAGFVYAGVPFAVGTDIRILAMGNLDGTGRALVYVVPPFLGSSLDRYYIQAVVSPVPNFVPLQAAPGNVLVNGDLAGLAASGLAGPAGPAGAEGPTGLMGPAGPTGATGAQGPQGPAGATGAAGAQGPAGPAGPQGPAGADGTAGAQGPQGPAGADGAVGPQGPAGADGAVGPQGPAGPQGLQGVAGADGAAGPQGPVGAVGPQGPVGVAGPQGPAGADGAPGVQGPQGPAGVDGAPGAVGPQGPAGAGGAVGPQGPAGPAGADGAAGPMGLTGPQGPQGVPGSIANVVVRTAAATATSVTVLCNTGEVTFGGGGSAASVANNQTLLASIPVSGTTVGNAVPATNGGAANGWRVAANVSLSLTAYVICGS
jgi:hypothetical protein